MFTYLQSIFSTLTIGGKAGLKWLFNTMAKHLIICLSMLSAVHGGIVGSETPFPLRTDWNFECLDGEDGDGNEAC